MGMISSVPLWQYARDGNLAQVDRLTKGSRGRAKINDMSVEKFMINWCPLLEAAEYGHVDVVIMLLDRGGDINILSSWGGRISALMMAARNGRVKVVSVLLDRGAISTIDLACWGGGSALTMAAERGHKDVVSLLLDRGADIELKSNDNNGGETPLLIAARGGHCEVISLLIDRGAKVDYLTQGSTSALILATSAGHVDAVRVLLDRGATIDLQNRTTAWYYSFDMVGIIEKGHEDIVAFLLERGARLDIKDSGGDNALDKGSKFGSADCIKLLQEAQVKRSAARAL